MGRTDEPLPPVQKTLSNGSSSGAAGGVAPSSSNLRSSHTDFDDEPCEMINNNVPKADHVSLSPSGGGGGGGGGGVPPRGGVGGVGRVALPPPQPSPATRQVLEKTTEGVLKAARLGDLKMLSELHAAEYSLLSIDETGKTALHYGARFGHKEVRFQLLTWQIFQRFFVCSFWVSAFALLVA